jgi:hypothetical protein
MASARGLARVGLSVAVAAVIGVSTYGSLLKQTPPADAAALPTGPILARTQPTVVTPAEPAAPAARAAAATAPATAAVTAAPAAAAPASVASQPAASTSPAPVAAMPATPSAEPSPTTALARPTEDWARPATASPSEVVAATPPPAVADPPPQGAAENFPPVQVLEDVPLQAPPIVAATPTIQRAARRNADRSRPKRKTVRSPSPSEVRENMAGRW